MMSLENVLLALTPAEKLAAMNILWRDLSSTPARLSSPDWHGDVLASRIANPSTEPRLPIDEAFVIQKLLGRCEERGPRALHDKGVRQ